MMSNERTVLAREFDRLLRETQGEVRAYLASLGVPLDCVDEFVAAVERRVGLEPSRSLFAQWRQWFAHRPRVAWSFIAAAACVVLVASVLWLAPSPAAQIAATQGDVRVWRKQVTRVATSGFKLQAGDWLLTGTNGSVTVAFPGETTRLALGTNAEFGVVTARPGKQLKLVAGTMRASVARQSASHPMLIRTPTARAEVLGTKFELSATELTTRLRVEEGRVLFAGTNDESGVVIEATQSGVVTGDAPVAVLAPPPAQTLGYALLAYWKLDGNGADASGQSNDLALGNGVVFTNGRLAQALDLRAAKVDVESPRLVLPPVFTLSLWLNLNQGGPGRLQPLIGFDGQHVGVDDFFLSLIPTFPGSSVTLNVRGRQMGSQALSKRSVIAVGRWQHLAVIVDSTQGRAAFYVEGREVTERAGLRQGFRLAGPLLIGRRVKGGPQPFDGQLDDIRVYGRALSAVEITALAEGVAGSP